MELDVKPYSEQPFKFTGKSTEFFGIWIVNIALTILTLGIYSAWAKVRTYQYFYGNTQLDSSAFQYLASPMQILKGRILASILFVIYYLINSYNGLWGLYIAGVIALLVPAIIVLSMAFRLRNTAYRGITFRFERNFKQAYLFYGLPVFLFFGLLFGAVYSIVPAELWDYSETLTSQEYSSDGHMDQQVTTIESEAHLNQDFEFPWLLFALFPLFALAYPLWQYLKTLFIVGNSKYGTSFFTLNTGPKSFYIMYVKALGIFLLAIILAFWVMSELQMFSSFEGEYSSDTTSSLFISQLVFFLIYLWMFAYLQTKRFNLIFNHVEIEEMSFSSTLSVGYMMYLYVTNTIGIICSVGLLIPWSMVRTARYRASQLTLLSEGSLDQFVADQQTQLNAIGEEFGEVFDIDVGI